MMNDASPEQLDGAGSPAASLGEASAFVASLFAGLDQDAAGEHDAVHGHGHGAEHHRAHRHGVVGEDVLSLMGLAELAPPEIAPPEPAPAELAPPELVLPVTASAEIVAAEADPIATRAPAAAVPSDREERNVPSRRNTRALLPYSDSTVYFVILFLALLIFVCGLAVGYGVFGRASKAGRSLNVRGGTPAEAGNAAPAKKDSDQASMVKAVSGPATDSAASPAITPVEPSDATLSPVHDEVLPDLAMNGGLQSASAHAGSEPTERIEAVAVAPPVSAPPPSVQASVASQPVGTSTQPVAQPQGAANGSAHTENVAGTAKAPDAPVTIATPKVDASGMQARTVPVGVPQAPQPIAPSLDHVDPCQLIHSVQPVYPDAAKKLGVEGDVELRLVVAADGTVGNISLVSGAPSLASAAMDAARQFRYKPAMLNGQPIETVQTVDMSFKLKK